MNIRKTLLNHLIHRQAPSAFAVPCHPVPSQSCSAGSPTQWGPALGAPAPLRGGGDIGGRIIVMERKVIVCIIKCIQWRWWGWLYRLLSVHIIIRCIITCWALRPTISSYGKGHRYTSVVFHQTGTPTNTTTPNTLSAEKYCRDELSVETILCVCVCTVRGLR